MGNYTKSEINEENDAHVSVRKGKMSTEGRQFKKPSQQEIYRDAARIVEELLCSRLEAKSPSNSRQNFTRNESYVAASADDALQDDSPDDETYNDDEELVRSQTAPSRFKFDVKVKDKKQEKSKKSRNRAGSKSKKSQDGESKHGVDTLSKGDYNYEKKVRDSSSLESKSSSSHKKKENLQVNGYVSSSESDGENKKNTSSPVRRKKSFFKKAKERLIYAFHRDEKSDDDDICIHGSEKDKKRKKMKHKSQFVARGDTNKNASSSTHVEKDLKWEEKDLTDGNDASPENEERPFRRNSAGKRFLDSVRKSFRMKKKSHVPESHSVEPVSQKHGKDYSRSTSTPNDHTSLLNTHSGDSSSGERKSFTKQNRPARLDIGVSQNNDHSPGRTFNLPGLNVDAPTVPKYSSRLQPDIPEHGFYSIDSERDNVQDFVITDDGLLERNNSGSRHQQTGNRDLPQTSLEIDGKGDEDDGDTELKNEDQDDIPFDQKSDAEKEEIFAKIVQKLIEIGDNLAVQSHSDDARSPSTEPQAETITAGAPGDDTLNSLEREILMCLRDGGDRYSESMEDPAAAMIQGAKQSVYDQFSQTIRRSVGDEVNWNQMALVFHASRSAFKAVGVGTAKARRLKDVTVKYVTDMCASWIYEQGGWETVVSEDSDLD